MQSTAQSWKPLEPLRTCHDGTVDRVVPSGHVLLIGQPYPPSRTMSPSLGDAEYRAHLSCEVHIPLQSVHLLSGELTAGEGCPARCGLNGQASPPCRRE